MSDVAPLNLQDLQADLQTQLEAEYFPTDPIQVRCLFKEGLLLVLVQHQAPAPAELPPLFRLIRDRLQGDPRVQSHALPDDQGSPSNNHEPSCFVGRSGDLLR